MSKTNVPKLESKNASILKEILTHSFFFLLNSMVILLLPMSGEFRPLIPDAIEIQVPPGFENATPSDNVTWPTSAETQIQLKQTELSNHAQALGWSLVVIYILFKITNELQKVYFLYGLFRSPIYSFCALGRDVLVLLWHHLRSLFFNFVTALLMNYYVLCIFSEDGVMHWDGETWWWRSIEVLAIMRAFR